MPENNFHVSSFKMLDVSMSHLTAGTRKLLESEQLSGALYYPKGPWGWFVHVPPAEESADAVDDLPQDLRDCMAMGQRLNSDWLMIDRDAEPMTGLPVYEFDGSSSAASDDELNMVAEAYARHLVARLGRPMKVTVTAQRKISVAEIGGQGLYATVSADFARCMAIGQLPVVDKQPSPTTT